MYYYISLSLSLSIYFCRCLSVSLSVCLSQLQLVIFYVLLVVCHLMHSKQVSVHNQNQDQYITVCHFQFVYLVFLNTVIEIDTLGTFNCTKAAYEVFMKDHGGSIINISATLHYCGSLLQAHAGSAKAAIGNSCINISLLLLLFSN